MRFDQLDVFNLKIRDKLVQPFSHLVTTGYKIREEVIREEKRREEKRRGYTRGGEKRKEVIRVEKRAIRTNYKIRENACIRVT